MRSILPFAITFCSLFEFVFLTAHFDLLTNGITGSTWKYLTNSDPYSQLNMSQGCRESLALAVRGLQEGSLDSYRMLDSSSKPSSLTRGVIASFGDLDLCLQVGQYCLVKLFFTMDGDSPIDHKLRSLIPAVMHLHPHQAICLPARCSSYDVQALLHQVFLTDPIVSISDVNCQAACDHSWTARIGNLNACQWIALMFLLSIVSLTLIASSMDCRKEHAIISCFNWKQNYEQLTSVHHGNHSSVIDWFKIQLVIIGGIFMHSFFPLDHEYGIMMVGPTEMIRQLSESPIARTIGNDAGIDMFFFLSGFAAYKFITSLPSPVSLFRVVVIKWTRYLPGILTILSFDLLFGFWSTGPMYEIVAQSFVHKCSRLKVLTNFLMIQNVNSVLENCGVQFYYR